MNKKYSKETWLYVAEMSRKGFGVKYIADYLNVHELAIHKFLSGKYISDELKEYIEKYGYSFPMRTTDDLKDSVLHKISYNLALKIDRGKTTCKLIIATLPDGSEEEFYNMTEFANKHGLFQSNISHCLAGRLPHTRHFTFRYRYL